MAVASVLGMSSSNPDGAQRDFYDGPQLRDGCLSVGEVPVCFGLRGRAPDGGVAAGGAAQQECAGDGLGQDVRVEEDDESL